MAQKVHGCLACVLWLCLTVRVPAVDPVLLQDADAIRIPTAGANRLRILSPTLLELDLVNVKPPDPDPIESWNFVDDSGALQLPAPSQFQVMVNGATVGIAAVGFKRAPLYAPIAVRDLRVANSLYLQLSGSIADGQSISVLNPDESLWPASTTFQAAMDPLRFSPAVHVNQEGYMPGFSKKAMAGYYLGSLGEMPIPATFTLRDEASGQTVFSGALVQRPDVGYTYAPLPYQSVYEADFTAFDTPGTYRLMVPGLGGSLPFRIEPGVGISFARAYALGLYHQRCGTSNSLPWTRFTHEACHVALSSAPLPSSAFDFTWNIISSYTSDAHDNLRHTAPAIQGPATCLYPFQRQGEIDVSGGHHDAGDYSRYTINSAGLVHYLIFAVDSLPGVAGLDNLGIPESGDGISDLLQEAKWEADFLAKMQDTDGGFYFLVYPREREYEDDVLPDHGDPQVVWPKNTAVTAAAVGALAQAASSPLFRQTYPAAAALYLQKAQLGWSFLTNAIARHGKDGSYQKLTHYGDKFMHDDELAYAACSMYLATGDPDAHQKLLQWFDPSSPDTWLYGWWHVFEFYGYAIRCYAFGARSGRVLPSQLDSDFLQKCETEIVQAGDDNLFWSQQTAYATSFPEETKRFFTAAFYFAMDQAFDLAVAQQIKPETAYLDAILGNLNYEAGCNPVNVSFVTGQGWKRQHEVVNQYAQNDRRVLPPSGIPIGSIRESADNTLQLYGSELTSLVFPTESADTAPFPFYDRWSDIHNVYTEFVVLNQARSLATAAFIAASTPLKNQLWKSPPQTILTPSRTHTGTPITATLDATYPDLAGAKIIWEARDQQPTFGTNFFTFTPQNYGTQWVEVEIQWADGRRIFGAREFFATNDLPTISLEVVQPNMSEDGTQLSTVVLRRAGPLDDDLLVFLNYAGTATVFDDYRTTDEDVPESVWMPAGTEAVTLTFFAPDDDEPEPMETADISLVPDVAYNIGSPDHATMNILDNDLGILLVARNEDGSISLTWSTEAAHGYQVMYKTNLGDLTWQPISPALNATSGSTTWTDTTAAVSGQRFYAVRKF